MVNFTSLWPAANALADRRAVFLVSQILGRIGHDLLPNLIGDDLFQTWRGWFDGYRIWKNKFTVKNTARIGLNGAV